MGIFGKIIDAGCNSNKCLKWISYEVDYEWHLRCPLQATFILCPIVGDSFYYIKANEDFQLIILLYEPQQRFFHRNYQKSNFNFWVLINCSLYFHKTSWVLIINIYTYIIYVYIYIYIYINTIYIYIQTYL